MTEAVPQQQGASPEETARDLSHDLMSPYCPGRTIASCSSQQARDLEDEILQQAQAGKSREEIEQALVDRFGDEIVGYAGRPVVLYGSAVTALVAAVVVVLVGRRWVRHSQPAQGVAAPAGSANLPGVSTSEREALEDALAEVDEF